MKSYIVPIIVELSVMAGREVTSRDLIWEIAEDAYIEWKSIK